MDSFYLALHQIGSDELRKRRLDGVTASNLISPDHKYLTRSAEREILTSLKRVICQIDRVDIVFSGT